MKMKTIVLLLSSITVFLAILIIFAPIFTSNVLSGRIHFPEENIGALLTWDDGRTYTVFRRLKVEGKSQPTDAQAVFSVRFKFDRFNIKINQALSMIPVLFLTGMDGFREKYWAVDESTHSFLGLYQWGTEEIAENYPNSFVFGMLTKRAASNTLSYKILPNTSLSQLIQRLSVQQNGEI